MIVYAGVAFLDGGNRVSSAFSAPSDRISPGDRPLHQRRESWKLARTDRPPARAPEVVRGGHLRSRNRRSGCRGRPPTGRRTVDFASFAFDPDSLGIGILPGTTIGGGQEELGWRGFAQPECHAESPVTTSANFDRSSPAASILTSSPRFCIIDDPPLLLSEFGARKRQVELNATLTPRDPQNDEAEADSGGSDPEKARFRAEPTAGDHAGAGLLDGYE